MEDPNAFRYLYASYYYGNPKRVSLHILQSGNMFINTLIPEVIKEASGHEAIIDRTSKGDGKGNKLLIKINLGNPIVDCPEIPHINISGAPRRPVPAD